MTKAKIIKGSGNVFLDLGFEPAEAEVLLMRAKLMGDIRLYVERHSMTQAQAARVLGVSQSRVSDLMRGKHEKFSLDMLVTMATRLGAKVTVKLAA